MGDWVLTRIKDGAHAFEMMRAVMDVLAHKTFLGHFNGLLASILTAAQAQTLLKIDDVRSLVRERIPNANVGAPERALWITFFRECWLAGARYTEAELTSALDLGDKNPLTNAEVTKLGVDLSADKLLVKIAPVLAIRAFGFKILEEEPSFAKTLSDEQLLGISQLSANNDAHWVTCRAVIAQVEPACALQLAIRLFKHSRELPDLDLVKGAFCLVDGFTRKQTWLPTELGDLWKKFGSQIQRDVIDPAVSPEQAVTSVMGLSRLQRAPSTSSTDSWEVVPGVEVGRPVARQAHRDPLFCASRQS